RRCRFSTTGGLAPTGLARDGEVEDYRVPIVSAAADLAINVTISPNPLVPPNNGHCVISIVNLGPSMATRVRVTNSLPGVQFLSTGSAANNACTVQDGNIICLFDAVAPNETRSISNAFRPLQSALLTDVASVQS